MSPVTTSLCLTSVIIEPNCQQSLNVLEVEGIRGEGEMGNLLRNLSRNLLDWTPESIISPPLYSVFIPPSSNVPVLWVLHV